MQAQVASDISLATDVLPSPPMETSPFRHPNRARRSLQMAASLVAMLLVGTQVLAEWHVDGDPCPEEHCVLCAHSDGGLALAAFDANTTQQLWTRPTVPRHATLRLASRPFENPLSRAPPVS